jgi:hypothetical protein
MMDNKQNEAAQAGTSECTGSFGVLTWRKEPPDVAGWWWVRGDMWAEEYVVHVEIPGVRINRMPSGCISISMCEWAGPIEKPNDRNDEWWRKKED